MISRQWFLMEMAECTCHGAGCDACGQKGMLEKAGYLDGEMVAALYDYGMREKTGELNPPIIHEVRRAISYLAAIVYAECEEDVRKELERRAAGTDAGEAGGSDLQQ